MYEVTATIDKTITVTDTGRTVDEAKVKIMKRYPDKILERIKSVEIKTIMRIAK